MTWSADCSDASLEWAATSVFWLDLTVSSKASLAFLSANYSFASLASSLD
jgi:hypothetical protein